MDTSITTQRQYPKGFFSLIFILLFFMTAFALIQSLLVLYCTSSLQFNDTNAYALYAAYGSLVFGGPLLGGYLGGNILGYKKAVQIGLVLAFIGLIGLALPDHSIFYVSLSSFVMGTSLTIPNIYCLISQLYGAENSKRESGFTLSYMGMNFGGFFAMAASGFMVAHFGYHYAFLIGAIALFLANIIYITQQNHFVECKTFSIKHPLQLTSGYILTFLAIPLWLLLLQKTEICNALLITVGVVALLYGAYAASFETGKSKQKMILFLTLLIVCVAFWSLYSLSPTALTLFIERNVNRHVLDWTIPTSSIMSLNPFFIVTAGVVFNLMYLRGKKKTLSIPAKIATGTILMGLGYIVLDLGIHAASITGYTALAWIVLSYFLQTTGELFVGPIGFAMVGSLVPEKFEGIMMGMWQLCIGVSSIFSGYLAKMTSVDNHTTNPLLTNAQYAHSFDHFGSIAIGIGFLIAIVVLAHRYRHGLKEERYGESFS